LNFNRCNGEQLTRRASGAPRRGGVPGVAPAAAPPLQYHIEIDFRRDLRVAAPPAALQQTHTYDMRGHLSHSTWQQTGIAVQ
jgi:hypothetical protein